MSDSPATPDNDDVSPVETTPATVTAPESSTLTTPPGSRRLVWTLSAVIAVLAIALAVGLGFMLGQRDGDSSTAAPKHTPGPTKSESLRSTAERMIREGNSVEALNASLTESQKYIEKWAEPTCAATINAFIDAFAGMDDGEPTTPSAPTTIVSVEETGDSGVVVTRSGEETETQHWKKVGSRWMITCEGLFDPDETTEPTQTPEPVISETVVDEPVTETPVADEPYVVECLPGTPGPARFSDGTMHFSQKCYDENGGAAYMEAESQSGKRQSSTPSPRATTPR